MKPELMTRAEYVSEQTTLDKAAQIEQAGSLFRIGEIEAAHLHHVRIAVMFGRDIYIDNWSDYRAFIPGLTRYTFNGNLAVLDSTKGTDFDRAKAYRDAVRSSEDLERTRRTRRIAP